MNNVAPISSIPNVKFISTSSRCHQHVLNFVVAMASFGAYRDAYFNLPVTTYAPNENNLYPTVAIQGQASRKSVEFIPHDVLTSVIVNNNHNIAIPYIENNTFIPNDGAATDAASIIEGLAQAMFVGYYESHLASIKSTFGDSPKAWSSDILKFSKIVRDAISHGGYVNITTNGLSATHFGLTLDQNLNGSKMLHDKITSADIFFLMLEADKEF